MRAMTDNNVVTFAQPDAAAMAAHLNHLFDGFLDGAHDGMIELAWTDAADGRLRHAEMFGTDDMERIAERAAVLNAVPGQNVYVGAALRKPGTFPGGRAEDEDYYCTTAFYADLDDEGAADLVKSRYRGCMPTMAVVTGRTPHTRVQLWWRLETPERDAELHRAQCLALAIELGGDRTVVNPSRVMRLGGSIAWPRKAGRVIEKTEVQSFKDGRPLAMMPGQLAKAYPPMSLLAAQPTPAVNPAAVAPQEAIQAPPPAEPVYSPLTGRLRPSALMTAMRRGERTFGGWHNTMIRLVAHWVGRGWSDDEILGQAAGLTLQGYTERQTIAEMAAAIRGARAKWGKPSVETEFDPETGEVVQPGELRRAPEMLDLDQIDQLEPPSYVVEDTITETGFTLIYGPTASFKSFLALDLLLCMAYGKPWCGKEVLPKTVLYIAGEGVGGVKKRVRAWRQEHGMLDTKAPFYMLRHGLNFTKPEDIDALLTLARDFTQRTGLTVDFAAVDTVARAMVGSDENDASSMGLFVSACDKVRHHLNCGLIAVHHTGKDKELGARGSNALPAAVDTEIFVERTEGTERMTMKITKQKDDEETAPRRFVAVKVDLPRAGIKPVTSLVLKPDDEEQKPDNALSKTQVNEVLKEVARAWQSGNPWSNRAETKKDGRWLPKWIAQNYPVTVEQAMSYVEELLFNQFMVVDIVNTNTKKRGLTVLKYHV